MENWIYWYFCSFNGTWGCEISAKFSIHGRQSVSGLWRTQLIPYWWGTRLWAPNICSSNLWQIFAGVY